MSPRDRFWNPHQIKVDDKEVNPPINTTERTNVFGTLYSKTRADPSIDREYGKPDGVGGGGIPGYIDTQVPFPLTLPGCLVWCDATRLTGFNDGDPVGTFSDLSRHGHDFTQGTPANKPLYKVNIQNGLPILRFDGVNDSLGLALTNTVSVFTIVMVGCYRALSSNESMWECINKQHLRLDATNHISMFGSGSAPTGPVVSIGQFFVAIARYNAAGPGVGNTTLIIDNIAYSGTVPGNVPYQNWQIASNGGVTFVQIDVGEHITYERLLSDPEAAELGARLKTKWGTP